MKARLGFAALGLILASLVGSGAVAQEPTADSAVPTISSEDRAAIQQAIDRGLTMYRYDQAPWHTTDALLAALPQEKLAQIRGWIVTPAERGLLVTYYGGEADQHFGVYSAVWTSGTQVIDGQNLSGPLTGEIARLAAVRDAASSGDLRLCSSRPFNTIILPRGDADHHDSVYFLTPQTATGSIPMGGHHRVDVFNGEEVARRSFTRSCIELTPGDGAEALVITHSLDRVPTEVHVFSVYALRVPLFVGTNEPQRVWAIELVNGQPRIRLITRPQ